MPCIIDFNEEITVNSIENLIKSIEMERCLNKEIYILIESYGGNPNCLKALEEYLGKNNDVHINTIGVGQVASAAASLFMLGEKRCFLHEDSYLLLHEPIIPALDNAINFSLLKQMELELNDVDNVTFHNFFKKTKISKDMLKKHIENSNEWIIHSNQAKQLGIINTKIEDCLS